MPPVDLRSDTVTKPTAAMRAAMAAAELGDDVYGEDPTINELERRVAELLGKDRALFVPSGTMSNQLAIMVQTRKGDEIVIGEGAHCAWYESGGAAAWSGVQFAVAGSGGLFDAVEMEAAVKPTAYYLPRTSLVVIENTHNGSGGRVFPQDTVLSVAARARELGLATHLDGARLWNASVATGLSPAELAAPFDTVSVCFSKGLGAPVGSALVGSDALITDAHRFRKMIGGGMRQAGILAAAALHALDHHVDRLRDDHEKARELAAAMSGVAGATVDPGAVETNIVNINLLECDAEPVIAAARERGVLVGAMGRRKLRAVTHLDVTLADAVQAGARLAEVIDATGTR